MSSGKKLTTRHSNHLSSQKELLGKKSVSRSRSRQSLEPKPVKSDIGRIHLTKSREKLTETLNTYTLLIRSNNPIRCLQHNSNISIYCQTQQKLLCANCIFGRTQHKFHRVTPVDKSLDKIQKDVDTMNRLIDRELITMKKVGEKLMNSLIQEQNDTHQGLASLIEVYEQCHRRLEQNFLRAKEKVVDRFDKVRIKYQKLMFQLNLLTQDYSMSSVINNMEKEFRKKQEILLFEHSICSAIAGQKRFVDSDWVSERKQVALVTAQQKKRAANMLQALCKLTPKLK